jgi:amino acid transporter
MASGEIEETLLPKWIALAVFSSDPLSSVAYATQEILLVLGTVGAAALANVIPISVAIALLLAAVVASYRQVCLAYPNGGGSYVVSKENLGMNAGLLAASALLVDYVMTAAVSIVAGVDAIVSAAPRLAAYEVEISIAVVILVAAANLRGVRESGRLFSVPTYLFVGSILTMIALGAVRCIGGCPQASSANAPLAHTQALTWFVILRAFAAGNTALTGTEAISNGVPAFRFPQSKNAAATLVIMASLSITMFLGVSTLAHLTHVHVTPDSAQTVVAQIAGTVFGRGAMFYVVQIATALILVLAANTAFNGLPRLCAVLAQDRSLPRHFMNLGDRLVYSNGILILTGVASLLIWVFNADLTSLIQLYLVGVFVAFTLSQFGLVVHWRRLRPQRWRRRAALNGVGGALTGLVLVIILLTKFASGAWLVVVTVPTLIFFMRAVHRHYEDVARQLEDERKRPPTHRRDRQHLVILANAIDSSVVRAISYAGDFRVSDVTAVTFEEQVMAPWRAYVPDIPISLLGGSGSRVARLQSELRRRRRQLPDEDFLTLVTPEILSSRGALQLLRHPFVPRVKAALLFEPGVAVMDVPVVREHVDPAAPETREPIRNDVLVLVNAVSNVTLQALAFAQTLNATSIRGMHFSLGMDGGETVGNQWLEAELPYPLEIEDSPFRSLGRSLIHYVRNLAPDGVERVVTIVLPEFVVPTRRHQVLHGQTALLIKRYLLFERGVVVASVPYRLEKAAKKSPPIRPSLPLAR